MSPDVQGADRIGEQGAGAKNCATLLLSVATELFAAKGFQGTSITDVCTTAGVSRPVIYYFYGSKKGLYRAVLKSAYGHFNNLVASADDINTPVPKRLSLARLLLDDATQSPLMWRLLLSAIWSASAPSTDDIRALHEKLTQTLVSESAKRVWSQAADSARRDATAHIFAGALFFVIARYLTTGKPDLTSGAARDSFATMFDRVGRNAVTAV